MKRSEIRNTIAEVGELTFKVGSKMQVVNNSTGETVEVDPESTFMVVRGVLMWFEELLAPNAKHDEKEIKSLQSLMFYIGKSIAFSLESDEED